MGRRPKTEFVRCCRRCDGLFHTKHRHAQFCVHCIIKKSLNDKQVKIK